MIFIIISIISLLALVTLHEFAHFLAAKKFGVKVEEFGIGYPPRIIGKKFGETIYSLNLIPFGAFVRIHGEIGELESSQSFSAKPIWQRAIIVLAGVVSFWIVAAILLSFIMSLGVPTAISDDETAGFINPKIQILEVSRNSPADIAGLKVGDNILKFSIGDYQFSTDKVKEFQGLTDKYKGQEIILTIERGNEVFTGKLVPRVSPPNGEGPMGLALVRTAIKNYPWYEAPWRGIKTTINLTVAIVQGYIHTISNVIAGQPSGVQPSGPIGIVKIINQAAKAGISQFLWMISLISIYVAIFNILPIPALDGGKLLFLVIEAIKKKPISQKIEQGITTAVFVLLIVIMIFVTIKFDIPAKF